MKGEKKEKEHGGRQCFHPSVKNYFDLGFKDERREITRTTSGLQKKATHKVLRFRRNTWLNDVSLLVCSMLLPCCSQSFGAEEAT